MHTSCGKRLLRTQTPESVRAGDNLERACLLVGRVQVYAYCDRVLKDFERRLDEEAAIFLGPSRVTESFLALRDRDTEVLMQGDQPISHRRFRATFVVFSGRCAFRERNRCQVDFRMNRIQTRKPYSQQGLLSGSNLQVVKRSVADANENDCVGQVSHDLGEVRHLQCGATSPDN